jgi:hypothetical protein
LTEGSQAIGRTLAVSELLCVKLRLVHETSHPPHWYFLSPASVVLVKLDGLPGNGESPLLALAILPLFLFDVSLPFFPLFAARFDAASTEVKRPARGRLR